MKRTLASGALVAMAVTIGGTARAQAIFDAVRSGDTAAVHALLSSDSTLVGSQDRQERPLLVWAVIHDQRDVAALLLGHGAAIEGRDRYGRTPLLLVARETGNAAMARMLLDAGAQVDARDRFRSTPLELASWRGFGDVVNLLLDRGARVPEEPEARAFYVQQATENGLDRLFDLAAGPGADLEMRNDNGGSLLHSAAAGGSAHITGVLIERGLAIDQQDRYGRTPLHYAAENGRTDAARMLLDRGARTDVRSLAGVSPLNSAEAYQRTDVARLLIERGADRGPVAFPELRGPYLGQQPPAPGSAPVLFAPDIVSTHAFQHGTVVFSPDGKEAYWSTSLPQVGPGYVEGMILTSRVVDGRWTAPERASFSRVGAGDDVPFFKPDGSKLFFLSTRDGTGERIWWVDRTAGGWSVPRRIEGGPNTMDTHWEFSVAPDGSIYFQSADPGGLGRGDLYVSRLAGGTYQAPQNLGAPVNSEVDESAPFIAPDGSYLLFMRLTDRQVDLYVSFRNADGTWAAPRDMGPRVNTDAHEICPIVTPDGRYLFFNSARSGDDDNYWMDAGVIAELRRS